MGFEPHGLAFSLRRKCYGQFGGSDSPPDCHSLPPHLPGYEFYNTWNKALNLPFLTGILTQNTNISLVDCLAEKAECCYVSDLHYLDANRKYQLSRAVEKLASYSFSLSDRNDALEYIVEVKMPCSSSEQAKSALISGLFAPDINNRKRW